MLPDENTNKRAFLPDFAKVKELEGKSDHIEVEIFFVGDDGRVLLTRRSPQRKRYSGAWSAPGGRSLPGESGEDAARREMKEQLCLDVDMRHARLSYCRLDDDQAMREVYIIYQSIHESDIRPDPELICECRLLLPEQILADSEIFRSVSGLPNYKALFPIVYLESMRKRIPLGHYRHFKGNEYLVKSLALHSETQEPMVIYQAMYGSGETWVRPASMWL